VGRRAWVEDRPQKEESFLGVLGKKYPETRVAPSGEAGVDAQTRGQRTWPLVLYLLCTWTIPGPGQGLLQSRQGAMEVIFICVQIGSTQAGKCHPAASADVNP